MKFRRLRCRSMWKKIIYFYFRKDSANKFFMEDIPYLKFVYVDKKIQLSLTPTEYDVDYYDHAHKYTTTRNDYLVKIPVGSFFIEVTLYDVIKQMPIWVNIDEVEESKKLNLFNKTEHDQDPDDEVDFDDGILE